MKIRNVFLGVLGLISLNSCENYLDINDSPNNARVEQIPVNLKLAAAQTNTYRIQARRMEGFGHVMMQMWAGNVNTVTGGFLKEFNLNIDNGFYDDIWDNLYRPLANYSVIINDPSPAFENHKAIAKVMLAFHMQQLVDLYGDVPYSEAFKYGQNPTPTYDDDKTIYRQIYALCEDAKTTIDSNPVGSAVVGIEDVIFMGDMAQWRKMASTVQLRLLLRESTLAESNGDSQTYLNEKFAALAGSQFLDQDATINPGYNNSTDAAQNPFYNAYGFNSAGVAPQNNGFVKASQYAAQFLNGTGSGSSVVDPRRGRFFALIGGAVVGVEQGNEEAPANLSGLGPALIVDSAQDGYIITLAESKFMQSEAILRGYLPGNAETAFNEGIQASMSLAGVAAADVTAYQTATAFSPRLGFVGSFDGKLESIMTQKWLAEMQVNAWDSFIDYTRTGYPNVPLALTAIFPERFKRLLYPQSEATANSANVPAQSQASAFSTGPFWYVP